jgi:glutathione S-transferase
MALQLLTSFTSPFGRRVRVAIIELDLSARVELIPTDPWSSPAELIALNPLAQVPALITDSGEPLTDSSLILEYLQTLGSGLLAAPSEPEYWQRRREEQLAIGLLEAAVKWVVERRRPSQLLYMSYLERQVAAISRTLEVLEKNPARRVSGPVIGTLEITLAVALEYLEFRMPQLAWRNAHPQVAQWLTVMSERPSMSETRPPR